MPTAEDFRLALSKALEEASRSGADHLEITAGELHRRIGGYPGPGHRIPNCCQVMKAAVVEAWGDRILYKPPSGMGANLKVWYRIPRG